MDNSNESRQTSLIICLIFIALGAALIMRHEMWRDEIQTWLLIRDTGSFWQIFGHLKNELHPFLWYVLVFPLKYVIQNPEIMKPLHLLIASIGVYIFFKNAPFSRLNKILFVFGYFPFFEYGIIARDYALLLLFSVLLASMYTFRQTGENSRIRSYGITISLFLICQTHLFGVIIGGIFSLLLAWDAFAKREYRKLFPLVGFLGGVGIFVAQIFPLANYYTPSFNITDNVFLRMQLALRSVWRGFFPFPVPFLHFWNSNILDLGQFFYYLQHFLAFLVLLGSVAFVITLRESRAILFYCLGTFLIMSAIYATGVLGVRFPGFIFIIFILALWMGYGLKSRICGSKIISLLLLVHVAASSVAYYYDMKYPFSAAKQTARFIANMRLREPIIVGYNDATAISLAGYLNNQIYYPQANRFGSYLTWDETSLIELNTCDVVRKAAEIRSRTKRTVLIVLNYMPKDENCMLTSHTPCTLLGWFSTAIVPNEVYSVWIMQ